MPSFNSTPRWYELKKVALKAVRLEQLAHFLKRSIVMLAGGRTGCGSADAHAVERPDDRLEPTAEVQCRLGRREVGAQSGRCDSSAAGSHGQCAYNRSSQTIRNSQGLRGTGPPRERETTAATGSVIRLLRSIVIGRAPTLVDYSSFSSTSDAFNSPETQIERSPWRSLLRTTASIVS